MRMIAKWGNSLAFRIPSELARSLQLQEGTAVEVRAEKESLVLTPVKKRYELSELLEGVTKDNIHSEVDWGDGVGEEVW